MAPSVAANPTSAVRDGGVAPAATPTAGFQPVIIPASDAKMKAAGRVPPPAEPAKSVVLLNTCPVGAPPGMLTLNGWLIGLPLTSPPYTSLRSAPLDDTQKAPPSGFSEMPQALTRVGSVTRPMPGWSAIRSVAR